MKRTSQYILFILLFLSAHWRAAAQQVLVNMATLDGMEVTPANIYSFQVVNSSDEVKDAVITGTLRYRNSNLRFSYTVSRRIQPGSTLFGKDNIGSPVWSFSDNGLKELFLNYSKLPEGTYEYCVSLSIKGKGNESIADAQEGCVYNRSEDIFLINLLEPEDNAKLYEQYPMFNWVVNYPFASELTYRIRIASQNKGQNPQNAITRNNPVYQDNHVMSTSMVYPVTAKPLEKWQPYVWTVDAYYKGILLGGAETWRFMIVEDSVLKSIPASLSYIDIVREKGNGLLYAIGELKLKYVLEEKKSDVLSLKLLDKDNAEIKLKQPELKAAYGDNRYEINFSNDLPLKHLKPYTLVIHSASGPEYRLPFLYINPDFLR